MNRWLYVLLTGFGIFLLIVGIWRWVFPVLERKDVNAAFRFLAAVPLEELYEQKAFDIKIIIPDDSIWKRIRQQWGDPGYIIAAIHPTKTMYCFHRLGLSVVAVSNGNQISLLPAMNALYSYSAECSNNGLTFRAPPGTAIGIRVTGERREKMPQGDLIVTAYWTAEVKDRLVGVQLNKELAWLQYPLAVCGAVGLAVVAGLFLRRRSLRP